MKKITLFSVLLLSALSTFSQTPTLTEIPSPPGYDDPYVGYYGEPLAIGTDLYFRSQANDNTLNVLKYDGNSVTTIPLPTEYQNPGQGYIEYPIVE